MKIGELKHRSDEGFLSNMVDGNECWLGFNSDALPGRTLVFGQICPTLYDCRCHETKGAFLVRDNRVLNGPLNRSLRSFARTAHSAHSLPSLRFATLASLAHSVHGLAHSLRSLPRGTVEILEYVFTLLSRSTGTNAFLVVTRNTPLVPRVRSILFYATKSVISIFGRW